MIGKTTRVAALVAAAAMVWGCDDKAGANGAGATTGAVTAASATPPSAPPASAASPNHAGSGAAGGGKVYDCGGKEQKPCPMQGWMKRVMAPASASGDGPALTKALVYVADHPPPGYADWTAIAGAGAVKAKAGDIDGARASCKQCHDAHKDHYKETMRDRPF